MFLFHPISFPISRKPVSIFLKIFPECYHFPLLLLLLLWPKPPICFQCIIVISLKLFSLSLSWSHFNLFLPQSSKIILLKCKSRNTGLFSGPLFHSELNVKNFQEVYKRTRDSHSHQHHYQHLPDLIIYKQTFQPNSLSCFSSLIPGMLGIHSSSTGNSPSPHIYMA